MKHLYSSAMKFCVNYMLLFKWHISQTLIVAVSRRLCQSTTRDKLTGPLIMYGKSCVEPGFDYFKQKFDSDLKNSNKIFEVAQLFLPSKITEMNVAAESLGKLSIIPFITTSIRENMKKELSAYVAKATGVDASVNVLEWWEKHSTELSTWECIARYFSSSANHSSSRKSIILSKIMCKVLRCCSTTKETKQYTSGICNF